ncbi:MerR family transcriptional regulator [Frigoribacterium sp. CFBP 13729]|uniref:transcriptional regulator FtsR n=1 Tax=unclassified Frigoribacterium TaxID=2627005 RepID=UPI0017823067|nr:MerR family transcriptional regulator [Frigoribacterium sp. CFBP 8766]MBD8609011.1 MerR family transcriptional regulator [Frigoribacterium sp. CFBP 13729]
MPGSAAARSSPTGSADLLTIGQVLARLKPEFPDLSNSKLRFLEERQLVTPVRTASGYRKFSSADVERLRFILGLQRDHYLPLKVIRQHLDDLDAGRPSTLPTGSAPVSMLSTVRRFSRADLLRESGASSALLDDAIASSLISPSETYGDEPLAVLVALVELGRSGIEPRHLRSFRAAAERELSLIESALASVARRRDPAGRARVAELSRELAGQLEVVRTSLIRSALDRLDT